MPRERCSWPHSHVDEHRGDFVAKHRWLAPTTLLVSLGLVAAACGSDNKGSTAATSAAAAAGTTAAPTTAAATSAPTTGGPTTTAAAAPVIPPAGTGKYGQDPNNKNLYVGPSGYTIDLSKCPSDYNVNQGITDSEIDMFASYPTSGPLAGYALI